jgi:hypothetical protein
MRSTYETIDGIVALLQDAQPGGSGSLPFTMPTVDIFDYCPGDFRFDGVENDDGIYIYFDETEFPTGESSASGQGHRPDISIDIYMSKTANKALGGAVTFSPKACAVALRVMVQAVYDAITHASFRRLLNEKITATTGNDNWDCSMVQLRKCEFIGTMRLRESSKTIMVQKFTLGPKVEEVHSTDDGIALAGRDDHVSPQRTADDDGSPE